LTEEEATMKAVRQAEADASLSMSARKSHVSSGMAFPFSEESLQALSNLKSDGFINLVQLVCIAWWFFHQFFVAYLAVLTSPFIGYQHGERNH
jgi:hypothetical protein